MRALAVLGVMLALPALAAAQSDADRPHPLVVEVDETGFVEVSKDVITVGDLYNVTFSNDDAVAHDVTLSGYGVAVHLDAFGSKAVLVRFDKAGTFTLTDQPSRATHTLQIITEDDVDAQGALDTGSQTGSAAGGSSSSRVPGIPVPLVLAGLAVVVLLRRNA